MAQVYDVSLKTMFLRKGGGIVRRILFGGKVTEVLGTEQPQVLNRRADLVVRTEDGVLHQVEFQASNESGFALRMMEYYIYLFRTHGVPVTQTVLYLGKEPMRLETNHVSAAMDFRFRVVNLREMAAGPLLASKDWTDNVLALLAKGKPEKVLNVVLPRIRAMRGEEQYLAAGTLTLLSGILGMNEILKAKMQEVGMIDVMENTILGPAIRQGMEEGLAKGLERGRSEAFQEMLQEQLTQKFGTLPAWAAQRLRDGSVEELSQWGKRVLGSTTLEDTLA